MRGRRYYPLDPKKRQDHDKAVNEPLWDVVFRADKLDAKKIRELYTCCPKQIYRKYLNSQEKSENIYDQIPVQINNSGGVAAVAHTTV